MCNLHFGAVLRDASSVDILRIVGGQTLSISLIFRNQSFKLRDILATLPRLWDVATVTKGSLNSQQTSYI